MTATKKPQRPRIPEPIRPLDADRVRQISGMLTPSPTGVGQPIDDREAWDRLGGMGTFQQVLTSANSLLAEPIPELTEDIYLDHVRTGAQEVYNEYSNSTRPRFTNLVLAECLEDRGRFLEAIHESIRALCAEPTWVHAFHDPKLRNWKREAIEIDLNTASLAGNMATTVHFLGDRLAGDVQQLIRAETDRRIFQPFLQMLDGVGVFLNQPKPFQWLELIHNWCAVCLSGVVGAALALIEAPDQRAVYVAAAERYIHNFLAGFPADGSCSEGLGYWGYGFGHFLLLAETIWQATEGKVDLFDDEVVREVAQYGARMEIMPGIYPVFADCTPGVTPSADSMRYVSLKFGLGLRAWEECEPEASNTQSVGIHAFPNSATRAADQGAAMIPLNVGIRSWFRDAGLYVGRADTADTTAIGVAFKGGNNAEGHNHNDLGSFVIALNGKLLLVDPGSELYTARTFSANRYDSNVLNSYGHSVPLVGGKLQSTGTTAVAELVRREFGEAEDLVTYDLSSAYDLPHLTRLQRTFRRSHDPSGLTVEDEVEFAKPTAFGTALVTFAKWRQIESDAVLVYDGDEAVRINLSVEGGPFEISAEQIEEDVRVEGYPTRIGINLQEPAEQATIQTIITSTSPAT